MPRGPTCSSSPPSSRRCKQRTIKRAREAGIPIIAINVEDPAPDQGGLDYLVYIGGDEEKGGYAAANRS